MLVVLSIGWFYSIVYKTYRQCNCKMDIGQTTNDICITARSTLLTTVTNAF